MLLALLVLLLLALLVAGVWIGPNAYALWKHGSHLSSLVHNPGAVLQAGQAARIKGDLAAIERALQGLRGQLRPVLQPAWLPWAAAKENLSALDRLMWVGADLAGAGQAAADGLQAIADAMHQQGAFAGTSEELSASTRVFQGLRTARPYFLTTQRLLAPKHKHVAGLKRRKLWSPLSNVVSALQRYMQLGDAALGAAAAAPTLLGEQRPVRYLVLGQNNDELRPTGGFITSIGVITIERGKITDFSMKDSYEYDTFTVAHPFAPEPMQTRMGIILWVTRDGNWWPDFPTSAKAVEDLYHLENPGEIDGVVAFDMLAVQALVRAIEPLQVKGHEGPVTGENVVQELRTSWTPDLPPGVSWGPQRMKNWLQTHRKDFIRPLTSTIMKKLQEQVRPEQLGRLAKALRQVVDEKHVLLYFHEPAAEGFLAKAGWDGTVSSNSKGDYLLALDTNMGYNKVNLHVDKSIDYQVSLGAGTAPSATVTITYSNHSTATSDCARTFPVPSYDLRTQGCYVNYARVYVPLGSQLLATEGVTNSETLADENGKTVFATFFVLPGGESQTIRFTYNLPRMDVKQYKLTVQKQAGTDAVPLRVRIDLAPGSSLLSADPKPQSQQQTRLSYDLDLRRDCAIELKLR